METWRRTGASIPDFEFNLLNGETWGSLDAIDGRFTLLNIYRGKWCHQCTRHLQQLDELIPAFAEREVSVVAVSADTRQRAEEFSETLAIRNLRVGYEMPLEKARELGVFVSAQAKEEEMPLFCEPAHFLIRSDHTIFAAWISSCAFARTSPQGILDYVDFIGEKVNKVPRGSA
ncbi:alkyl hydroperoxide reductase/ Thiol specific antioxidant/ Mal allergen [gamma proteobacterium NOR5-3]|nr:alkyl hydroperoxide reductase/ Thiol specific antioxidant/ Mal allergen [gamma proteobacterium NOR5-3]